MSAIIISTLVGTDTSEVLGNYTDYNTAVDDAKAALTEVVPDASISVKPSTGKIKKYEFGSKQEIRAVGTEFKVLLEVLTETPEAVVEVIEPDEVVGITEHEDVPTESLIEVEPTLKVAKPKKPKAQKYPDPIWAGEFRFWGCDQHTVKSYIDKHPEEVKSHGIELRKRGAKFALVCDKQTVWTCSYESVANLALEMAQGWAQAA